MLARRGGGVPLRRRAPRRGDGSLEGGRRPPGRNAHHPAVVDRAAPKGHGPALGPHRPRAADRTDPREVGRSAREAAGDGCRGAGCTAISTKQSCAFPGLRGPGTATCTTPRPQPPSSRSRRAALAPGGGGARPTGSGRPRPSARPREGRRAPRPDRRSRNAGAPHINAAPGPHGRVHAQRPS
jgi:translation initiation factor IF-2